MGNCCGQQVIDYEISQAKTLEDLIVIFMKRRANLPKEIEEINAYIKDSSKTITSYNIENQSITNDDLRKRVDHLKINIADAYDRSIQVMTINPKLSLPEVKYHLHEIYLHYLQLYELENEYDVSVKKFEEYGKIKGKSKH